MNDRPKTSPGRAALQAALLRYGLLLLAALLLVLVFLPAIGITVFVLFWVLLGLGAGAFIAFYWLFRRNRRP
ncbi:hypothetical protein BH24DEI1_BH24DEI1_14770 [soil metagenome]|jgi:Flp pilus assembly protein TadB